MKEMKRQIIINAIMKKEGTKMKLTKIIKRKKDNYNFCSFQLKGQGHCQKTVLKRWICCNCFYLLIVSSIQCHLNVRSDLTVALVPSKRNPGQYTLTVCVSKKYQYTFGTSRVNFQQSWVLSKSKIRTCKTWHQTFISQPWISKP